MTREHLPVLTDGEASGRGPRGTGCIAGRAPSFPRSQRSSLWLSMDGAVVVRSRLVAWQRRQNLVAGSDDDRSNDD